MDKQMEVKLSEKVKKLLSKCVKENNFIRSKPTFYTRVLEDRIEFIHLHKFTFGPMFRIHIGIRFLFDDWDAISLNGPDSDAFRPKFNLEYDETETSIDNCVTNIMDFVNLIAEPWFNKWKDKTLLINDSYSPLKGENLKNEYLKFKEGYIDFNKCNISYKLLGIKKI